MLQQRRILDIAALTVDMLTRYFPESVDKLRREISPVEGKKPVRANTQTTHNVESRMNTHAFHAHIYARNGQT
jgi:hypothetical protein